MWRRVKHWTNLQLAFIRRSENVRVDLHELSSAFYGLFLRFKVEDCETADQFFCLSERTVDHECFPVSHPDARPLGTGEKSPSRYERTTRRRFIGQFRDRAKQFLVRRN